MQTGLERGLAEAGRRVSIPSLTQILTFAWASDLCTGRPCKDYQFQSSQGRLLKEIRQTRGSAEVLWDTRGSRVLEMRSKYMTRQRKERGFKDFPGSPVVKIPCSQGRGPGFDP